jgi:hypothetical protein
MDNYQSALALESLGCCVTKMEYANSSDIGKSIVSFLIFFIHIYSCFSSYVPCQEGHKGDQIILPSSSYIVFLPPVKTLLEDLFVYQPDMYNAQRERQTRIICELTGSMRIKL